MATETQDRWAEIRSIHKQYRTLYDVLGGFTGIALLILFGFTIFAQDQLGFAANVYTETISAIASVIVTVLILDRRAEQREECRRIRELQERLVREAGSPDNTIALNALRELQAHDWLTGNGGLLNGANLQGANLEGARLQEVKLAMANLRRANMEGAHLREANLADADLWKANLDRADLLNANLDRVRLWEASLIGARSVGSSLERADLRGANFEGADLAAAKLVGADLRYAKFAEETRLPDGTFWTPDTDMSRFTDPDHPEFWQPDWVKHRQAGVDDNEGNQDNGS